MKLLRKYSLPTIAFLTICFLFSLIFAPVKTFAWDQANCDYVAVNDSIHTGNRATTVSKTITVDVTDKEALYFYNPTGSKYGSRSSYFTITQNGSTIAYANINPGSIVVSGGTYTGAWDGISAHIYTIVDVSNRTGPVQITLRAYLSEPSGTWEDSEADYLGYYKLKAFNVAFNANAPSGTSASGTMSLQSIAKDATVPLAACAYTVPGYKFKEWNTNADGSGNAYPDKYEVKNLAAPGSSTTLYAQWTPIVTAPLIHKCTGSSDGGGCYLTPLYNAHHHTGNSSDGGGCYTDRHDEQCTGNIRYTSRASIEDDLPPDYWCYVGVLPGVNEHGVSYTMYRLKCDTCNYEYATVCFKGTVNKDNQIYSQCEKYYPKYYLGCGYVENERRPALGIDRYTKSCSLYDDAGIGDFSVSQGWEDGRYYLYFASSFTYPGKAITYTAHKDDFDASCPADVAKIEVFTSGTYIVGIDYEDYYDKETLKGVSSIDVVIPELPGVEVSYKPNMIEDNPQNSNGNSYTTEPSGSTTPTVVKTPFTDVTLATNGFTRKGYNFAGWNTDKTAYLGEPAGTVIGTTDENARLGGVSSVVYYATWSPKNYAISFDGNGATNGQTTTVDAIYDKPFVMPDCGFIKNDAVFDGWNTKADGAGTKYDAGETYSSISDENIILYAQWKPLYTISFNLNGGLGDFPAMQKTKGDTLVIPSDIPTKTDDEFVCWATENGGGGTVYNPGDVYSADSSAILYAQYGSSYFGYTHGVQKWVCPRTGSYNFTLYGGNGYGDVYAHIQHAGIDAWMQRTGGNGQIVESTLYCLKGQVLYIAVGGNAIEHTGGWNGGGSAEQGYGGGGATSITTENRGELENFATHQEEVILVAAGGGGLASFSNGKNVWSIPHGGTIHTRYQFGKGKNGTGVAGGGGGGLYGGSTSYQCIEDGDLSSGEGGEGYLPSLKYIDGTDIYNKISTAYASETRYSTGFCKIEWAGEVDLTVSAKMTNGGSMDGNINAEYNVEPYTEWKSGFVVPNPGFDYEGLQMKISDSKYAADNAATIATGKLNVRWESLAVEALYKAPLALTETKNNNNGTIDMSWSEPDHYDKWYYLYESTDGVNFKKAMTTDYSSIKNPTQTVFEADTGGPSVVYDGKVSATGRPQTYVPPYTGLYRIILDGAGGGNDNGAGGSGARLESIVRLEKGKTYYVCVGLWGMVAGNFSGGNPRAGWNGGGAPGATGTSGTGGGATSISTISKSLDSVVASDEQYFIAIAGGGGGASSGSSGNPSALNSTAKNGVFGRGSWKGSGDGGGGGGGYRGGVAGTDAGSSATGGSSWVNPAYLYNSSFTSIALAGTEYENGKATIIPYEPEQKLDENHGTYYIKDTKAPDAPTNGRLLEGEGDFATWDIPQDNGNIVYYKVQSYEKGTDALLRTSTTISRNLIAGVGGYRYYFDNNPTGTVTESHLYTTATYAAVNRHTSGTTYLHVAAVDKVGNLGPTHTALLPAWYNLDIDPNGGVYNGSSTVTEVKVSLGQVVSVPNPTRKGFTFVGWNAEGMDTTKHYYSDTTASTSSAYIQTTTATSETFNSNIKSFLGLRNNVGTVKFIAEWVDNSDPGLSKLEYKIKEDGSNADGTLYATFTTSDGEEYVPGTWTNKSVLLNVDAFDGTSFSSIKFSANGEYSDNYNSEKIDLSEEVEKKVAYTSGGGAQVSYETNSALNTAGVNLTIDIPTVGELEARQTASVSAVFTNTGKYSGIITATDNAASNLFMSTARNWTLASTNHSAKIADYGQILIDKESPIGDISYSTVEWTNSNVTVTVNASDRYSGLHATAYSWDHGHTWVSENSKEFDEIIADYVYVRDAVGNWTKIGYKVGNIDKYEPWTEDMYHIHSTSAELHEWVNTPGGITFTYTSEDKNDPNTTSVSSGVSQIILYASNKDFDKLSVLTEVSNVDVEPSMDISQGETFVGDNLPLTITYSDDIQGTTYYVLETYDRAGNITTVDLVYKWDITAPTIKDPFVHQTSLDEFTEAEVEEAIKNDLYCYFNYLIEDYNTGDYTTESDSSGIDEVVLVLMNASNNDEKATISFSAGEIGFLDNWVSRNTGNAVSLSFTDDANLFASSGQTEVAGDEDAILGGYIGSKLNTYAAFPDWVAIDWVIYAVDRAGNSTNDNSSSLANSSGEEIKNFSIKTAIKNDEQFENGSDLNILQTNSGQPNYGNNIAYFRTGDIGHITTWTVGYVEEFVTDFGNVGEKQAQDIDAQKLLPKYNLGENSADYIRKYRYNIGEEIITGRAKNATGVPYATKYETEGWWNPQTKYSDGTSVRISPYYQLEASGAKKSDGTPKYKQETHTFAAKARKSDGAINYWEDSSNATYVIFDTAASEVHYRVTHEHHGSVSSSVTY